jgi:hypothetical protein
VPALLIFSESTCSEISKISYDFILRALLGIQVPQHDVYRKLPNHKKKVGRKSPVEKVLPY